MDDASGNPTTVTTNKPFLALVTDYGGDSPSSCGYCNSSEDSNWSHGMQAEFMPVETYQALLDQGWRRSGRWVYKPLHSRTCCQLITIRLDVNKFKPSKDQRRVQRRWEAHLAGAPLRSPPLPLSTTTDDLGQQQPEQQQQPKQPEQQLREREEELLLGGSPKRLREEEESEDADFWTSWDRELQGGGKRQRSSHNLEAMQYGGVDEKEEQEKQEEENERATAASPTAQLSAQLQLALGAYLPSTTTMFDIEFPEEAINMEQEEEGGGGGGEAVSGAGKVESSPSSSTAVVVAVVDLGAELAQELQHALQRCIDSGELPAVKYPQLKISRPTPKQQRTLSDDVAFTSAAPLAVAGVAKRAALPVQKEQQQQQEEVKECLSAESVAQLLLQHMRFPDKIVGADAEKGHLNFKADNASSHHLSPAEDIDEDTDAHKEVKLKQQQSTVTTTTTVAAAAAVAEHSSDGPPRHFQLTLVPAADPTLVAVEFDLYKKYQVIHHGDAPNAVTKASFSRFLCDTPLLHAPASSYPPGGAPPCGFGSFHQQYWLDGRLIAVGVIDVLPRALSSKYLFWDPDLAPLSLGKLASLQEIEWVRQASASCPSLHYYYLGFYLHDCHRMKYKAEFGPSDLLCPVGQCWVPIDRVQQALSGGGRPPLLSQVPGALQGLGEDYLVTPDGRPASPPRQPTSEEVGEVRLFVTLPSSASSSSSSSAQGRPRRGQVVTFGTLRALGVFSEEGAARLQARLERWMMLTGPAWRSMAYTLE